MKEIYSFITIGIYALWILYSAFVQKTLSYYTTDRYYTLILGSAIVSMVICITGLIYNLYKNRSKIKEFDFKSFDKKLILIAVLVLIGFVFLPAFVLAALLIFVPFKNSKVETHLNHNFISGLLVIVIISLGLILPSQTLSSNIADQRSDNLNSVNIANAQDVTQNFNTGTKNYNIGDWISSLNFNPDNDFYIGKEVQVEGFIFTPKIIDANSEFYVGRFVIRCCAADASPVGLKVKFDWNDKFKLGDWVKVTGVFKVSEDQGYEDLYIEPTNVESIPIPEKPYVS